MTFISYLIIVSILYVSVMAYFVRELVKHPSKEERRENQSGPVLLAFTFLFISMIVFGQRYFPA